MTLPLIRLLQQGPQGLAERVRQVLLAPDNHKREALRPCLAECDGVDYARRKAEELAGRAEGIGVFTAVGVLHDFGGGHGEGGASEPLTPALR